MMSKGEAYVNSSASEQDHVCVSCGNVFDAYGVRLWWR
jgi:hypothetical protein